MVRNYIRQTNRQSWDESLMLLAIKAVIDEKNSYNKASTDYNVAHSTLQDCELYTTNINGEKFTACENWLHKLCGNVKNWKK
jgi:hypothetical protein